MFKIFGFKIEHPKLDMVSAGVVFIILAAAGLFLFRVVVPMSLPETTILPIPFSTQAPNNNWDRNEDCEETSVTMANAFLTGNTLDKLPASAAQEAINNLKKWEQENLGYNTDTGVGATTKMAEGAFGLKIKQINNFTEEDLKRELADKHPILLPLNAKFLGTQQYINGGPTYHMVVIRGFKGSTFIINDPGTNGGNRNEYSFETLKKAAADWNNLTKSMEENRKVALVVSK